MLHDSIFTPLLSVDPATPACRGVPWNVLAAGRYKIRPLLRKQPDYVDVQASDPAVRVVVRGGIVRRSASPASPANVGVGRQVTRRILRELHKGSKPPQASRGAIRRRRAL